MYDELERITPSVKAMIGKWHSEGKIMWSGSLENNAGMMIFESTKEETDRFYEDYRTSCSDGLESHLYSWNAMPILSLIGN